VSKSNPADEGCITARVLDRRAMAESARLFVATSLHCTSHRSRGISQGTDLTNVM